MQSTKEFKNIRRHIELLITKKNPQNQEDVKTIFRLTVRKFKVDEELLLDVWNITSRTAEKYKIGGF